MTVVVVVVVVVVVFGDNLGLYAACTGCPVSSEILAVERRLLEVQVLTRTPYRHSGTIPAEEPGSWVQGLPQG